jgi:hypothetical protein
LTAGTDDSALETLNALFERAGFEDVAIRSIEVTNSFSDFDDFWRANTPTFHHVGSTIMALSEAERTSVIEIVRADLPPAADGSIAYPARANAIKARVPSA